MTLREELILNSRLVVLINSNAEIDSVLARVTLSHGACGCGFYANNKNYKYRGMFAARPRVLRMSHTTLSRVNLSSLSLLLSLL